MVLCRTRKIVETAIMRITLILFTSLLQARCQLLEAQDFSPTVTASCDADTMTIKVVTSQPFYGVIHAKDLRQEECTGYGTGGTETRVRINLLARDGDRDYCGTRYNNKTEERSLAIAVRFHKKLEVFEDKLYVITCGKPGFTNSRNETSLVSLNLLENGRKTSEAVYGRKYTLRVDVSKPDGNFGIGVKSCFSFSADESRVLLIDERGCPERTKVISKFHFNQSTGAAEATVMKMFRFPDTNRVNFQCDVVVCKGGCVEEYCPGDDPALLDNAQARSLTREAITEREGASLMASTSVYVVDPGKQVAVEPIRDCGAIHPPWLLYLCIAFGLLFLVMLIINVFLCSAMTCSCTKTEVIEKEPSVIEDYDPYRTWHGSQYGSRYSLNGKPYMSGGSTMNSARSMSTNSDHYAIVHSRPHSRYSAPGSHKSVPRGPPSAVGSQYSGHM